MNTPLQLILIIVILLAGCTSTKKRSDNKGVTEKNDSIVEQKFVSDEHGFSVWYSQDWKHEVFKVGNNRKTINIYPVGTADSIDFPLTVHENANISYISIFPDGYGTELPSGKSQTLENSNEKPVAFDSNKKESLSFLLENGQVWGYFIVPSSPPATWSQHGFIFAQAAVNDFEIKCFDKESGKELEMEQCNPLLGDSVTRNGEVVQEEFQNLKRVLNSIKFKDNSSNEHSGSSETTKGILVTTPQPGEEISSPVEITGKAKGNWFFEALIEIELQKNGNSMANTTGKAKSNWMTNDFVDFSATLKFPELTETGKAELVFKSSNPSGKKELEKSFSVPVVITE